ncbi:MAG: hypothetical protein JSV76_04720 [Candidatus Bathyarchaeota archaeon]|nr:MAG: hypothetical protein JSV76_04720 [Candidatus Bathyarchaeota archaeon]
MGKTEKGVKCSVFSCDKKSIRSISTKKVEASGLSIERSKQKRAYLCDKHYKEFKKKSRNAKRVDQWRWRP